MQPMVNLALRAARNAGQDLVSRLDRFDMYQNTDQEKAKFIADCTIGLEKNVIFEIKKSLPDHNFHGRETGETGRDERQPIWQICVIDDLTNFRLGIPSFAITISCHINGKVEHAVVTNPTNGDEFTASRGRGAQLNNRRIRCTSSTSIADAMIGVNFYSDNMTKAFDIRNIGSSALSICYVAANRFQGALLKNVDEFSLSAAGLVASEAGCLMTELSGQARIQAPANVAVSGPRLLKALLAK